MSGALAKQVAVVTGGSRGIGRAVVLALAREGADVVAVGRSLEALEQVAAGRPNIHPHVADLRKPKDVDLLQNRVQEEFGRIDILVNNAGVAYFAPLDELDPAHWDEMMEVNVRAAFLCCRAFIPMMKEQRRGFLLQIASVAGLESFPRGGGYCASKAAMISLTETLREELKPYEIRSAVLCPGSVKTDFGGTPPKAYALEPEDVAEVVRMMVTRPERVILNQVVMRPRVPREYQ